MGILLHSRQAAVLLAREGSRPGVVLTTHSSPSLLAVVSLGGAAVGLVCLPPGPDHTPTKRVRIEPLLVFLPAYAAYLTAEMASLSAILARVFGVLSTQAAGRGHWRWLPFTQTEGP